MMTLLFVGTAFALGVLVGAGFVVWRRERMAHASPWETPRTQYVAALHRHGARAAYEQADQAKELAKVREQSDNLSPVGALERHPVADGLALFEDGLLVLPDGSRVVYRDALRITIDSLRAGYEALHEASELLTEYAETLTLDRLRSHRSHSMRAITGLGAMYPLQPTIVQVAHALGADPDDATVGVGGAALWARVRQIREREKNTDPRMPLWAASPTEGN
ncbi:hypothetical protein AACH06_25525 [Ideonella sp. DXS29W]|uniref:Uncharacterized protein n=1 Tax=Ideonella lacteola TaxID=2984193 RepID=A0ABU9BWJ8_9BURK